MERSIKICKTRKCKKGAAPKSNRCYTCTKRLYRERHPIRNAYNNLRQNAKRRKKDFDLSFEQFKKWAIETSYIKKRGRTATSYHIDRIDPMKGYTLGNIRALTNSENVKRHAEFIAEYNYERGVMEFHTHITI